jgi:hypothetical protein
MRNSFKNLTLILILTFLCGGIFWHVQSWQNSGEYAEMITWTGTDRSWLTGIYDIGLMLVFAGVFGMLCGKLVDLVTKRKKH